MCTEVVAALGMLVRWDSRQCENVCTRAPAGAKPGLPFFDMLIF
jgi:hypothetical protein